MTASQFRRLLYRGARLTGDVQAASKGPKPLAKRLGRKAVYRRTNRTTAKVLRRIGLQ